MVLQTNSPPKEAAMRNIVHGTKHMILIAAGVATLAGSVGTPLASAQQKGNTNPGSCEEWQGWFNEDVNRANEAVTAGKPAEVTKSFQEAAHDLELAKDAGCSWASVASVPRVPAPVAVAVPISILAPIALRPLG
jgi:hypothetical protein